MSEMCSATVSVVTIGSLKNVNIYFSWVLKFTVNVASCNWKEETNVFTANRTKDAVLAEISAKNVTKAANLPCKNLDPFALQTSTFFSFSGQKIWT